MHLIRNRAIEWDGQDSRNLVQPLIVLRGEMTWSGSHGWLIAEPEFRSVGRHTRSCLTIPFSKSVIICNIHCVFSMCQVSVLSYVNLHSNRMKEV